MGEPIFYPDKPYTMTFEGHELRLLRAPGEGIPILMTAPWPQSIYAFHAIWNEIGSQGPIVAVDLPGFGQSAHRADTMAPAPMGAFIVRLAEELGLDRVHAVGPDVGTSALLFAAVERPSLFESIVIGSGGANMDLVGQGLRGVIEAAPGTYGEPEGGAQVVGTLQRMTRNLPPPEAMEDFRQSSAGRRWVEAADYVRAYPRDLPILRDLLPTIQTPVLVISGNNDPIVPPVNGDFLTAALPKSRHIVLETGHFVWEDAPAEYAALVRSWISGGYQS